MSDDIDSAQRYKSTLIKFMSWRDGASYAKDHEFTQQQLGAITPEEIHRWMCLKVYGMEEPGPGDNPTEGRSNSLLYWKKALSFFMPNNGPAWNVLTNSGNPTKSALLNKLIKTVKKKEVRRQGKPSSARRPFEPAEWEQAMEMIGRIQDRKVRYFARAVLTLQYNMIGRIDDTCKTKAEDLKPNAQFPFCLLGTMCWSKNVLDERDAPDQILIGAMDERYCILLALAEFLETNEDPSSFLFGIDREEDPKALKKKASDVLKFVVLTSGEFQLTIPSGLLGTHSVRKFASTRARRNGASRDDVDSRGRWRKRKRQSDTYIDPSLPYPDAKVAAILCKGGPIAYKVKDGSGISDDWIVCHIVPRVASRFPRQVAVVLGHALLWKIFDDNTGHLPDELVARVKTAYHNNPGRQLPENENPVQKVQLVVTGSDDAVYIDEIGADDADGGDDTNNRRVRRRLERDEIRALQAQVGGLRSDIASLQGQVERNSARAESQLTTINRNVRRLASQPARVLGRNQRAAALDGTEGVEDTRVATLSTHPKSLSALWQEYEFGIAGRKPAREFTAEERGRVKYQYTRRKVVWDAVAELVRAGFTASAACDKIYGVYGRNLSVTNIINRMRRDRVNGGHPQLRVVNA